MTKWKGEAASFAPNLAQPVSALARLGAAIVPAALLAALAASPAAAQTLYWDGGTVNGGNPAPNANGGTGTWNNTLTNWDTAATAGANSAWVSGADAAFTGTAGTVTVDAGGVAAHSLVFANGGWTVNGGTITMTGASPSITAGFQKFGNDQLRNRGNEWLDDRRQRHRGTQWHQHVHWRLDGQRGLTPRRREQRQWREQRRTCHRRELTTG